MKDIEELRPEEMKQTVGGARVNATFAETALSAKAPNCPICGTVMQATGLTLGGEPVGSGKWICPNCGYSQISKKK